MPDERQAQPAHGIVASVGQRHSLGRARLHAAKRSTVLLSGPVRDRSMLHGTNAAAVSCQPCEIQAACVKHGAETLARHAYPRVTHRRRPQGRRRTKLRRCRGCGNRRSRRWSRLRWWCDRSHPETRLQCSSHEQQQRRDDQSIPTHVRVDARACWLRAQASATRSRRQQSAQLCRQSRRRSARSVAAPASTCRGRHGPSPAHIAAVPSHCRHWFAAANQCGCHRPRLLVRCPSPSPSPSRGPDPDPNPDSNLRRQRLQSHGRHAHIPWHTHGGRADARVALAAVPRRTVDEADARAH